MKKNKHGANLFELAEKYHFNVKDIRDFSSNINPFGASKKALDYVKEHLENVSIYPDSEYIKLKQAISSYSKADTAHIILGEGATGLISKFIQFVNPKHSMVMIPAYSEYKSELNKIEGNAIFSYSLKKENCFQGDTSDLIKKTNEKQADILILCNPNNPTGSIFSQDDISYLMEHTSCYVMIDETYIEFTDKNKYSSAPLTTKYKKLFVVRGTSKFFSTPGIRLGYGLCSDEKVLDFFKSHTDLWNINIIATMMGEKMFTDTDYIAETYQKICTERNYLITELSSFEQLKVYPSYGNFILCEIISDKFDADYLYDKLISDALAIRNCASFETLDKKFFRICTLLPEDNQKLIHSLKNILAQ